MRGISIAGAHTERSVSARLAQSSYQSAKRTMGRSLGSPCLAACITSIIWRHELRTKYLRPTADLGGVMRRSRILPNLKPATTRERQGIGASDTVRLIVWS
jgi:hypothetical protein